LLIVCHAIDRVRGYPFVKIIMPEAIGFLAPFFRVSQVAGSRGTRATKWGISIEGARGYENIAIVVRLTSFVVAIGTNVG
jgi:hypothetical protein